MMPGYVVLVEDLLCIVEFIKCPNQTQLHERFEVRNSLL